MHDVEEKMPQPNVLLYIKVKQNCDHVGGGAAIYGDDGKWYWAFNGEKSSECRYPVARWCYLNEDEN